MDIIREHICKTWMVKASRSINGLRDGLGPNQMEPYFQNADGLICCSIAYEAYAFGKYKKRTPKENRSLFSAEFNDILRAEDLPDDLKNALNVLLKFSVLDMTPVNPYPSITPKKGDLNSFIRVIYRVRSNLFHGGKDIGEGKNAELIQASFTALYRIMEIVLHRDGIAF